MKRTTAAILCALTLAGCAAPAADPGLEASLSADYCSVVTTHEQRLALATTRAYQAGDKATHLALQLQLLEFLGDNPGGCYPQWWADEQRQEATSLRSVNGQTKN